MNNRLLLTGVLLAALFGIVSCSTGETEPNLDPLKASEISPERLWQRITEESNYTQYAYWPGHEGEQPGQSPHGVIHRIHVNRTLLEALPVADSRAPVGSLIVKENLNAAHELYSITVMAKVDGYDPEHDDWYWAYFFPDGSVRVAGSPAGCITCHSGVASNDYVIVQRLNAPLRQ